MKNFWTKLLKILIYFNIFFVIVASILYGFCVYMQLDTLNIPTTINIIAGIATMVILAFFGILGMSIIGTFWELSQNIITIGMNAGISVDEDEDDEDE